MPTIRRATWRPRKLFGHDVESYKTGDNNELETNSEFRNSDLTAEARELFLRMKLNIWFIRRPSNKVSLATLIFIDAHHGPTRRLLQSFDVENRPLVPVSARYRNMNAFGRTPGEGIGYIDYGNYHYSFVNGKVKSYINANPDYLWDAIIPLFYWDDVSVEDKRALDAVEV